MLINVKVKLPPVTRGLYYIFKDFEIFPYKPRNTAPCPATQKTLDDVFIKAIEEYQFFWFDCLMLLAPNNMTEQEIKDVFSRITHSKVAWTNKHGSDILADYVNGKNLDRSPFEQETLMDRGNLVNVIGDRVKEAGIYYLPCETITVTNLPPILDLIDPLTKTIKRPDLIHAMTTITNIMLEDGTYKANSFEDFGGAIIPLPIISRTGISYVPENMLKKIDENKPYPSPFNPPRNP
jgi:hypothetical protein